MCANTCARPASARSASAWARRPAPPGCPGQRLGPLGRGLDRAQHRQAARAAAQPGRLAANDIFADLLGLPTIWVPHSYPACAQHAPNEHLLGSVAREGLAIMAGLFWDLGDQGPALRDAAAPLRP